MLFRRARRTGLGERLRLLVWPRRSWGRSARYVFLRLKRLPSSPHRIAFGAALGVFAVFTPFLGVQMIIAGVLAVLMRGSIVASFLASFVGNPLTYPIIWFATFNLGNVLLGGTATAQLVDLRARLEVFGDNIVSGSPKAMLDAFGTIWPILKPMAVGSLPLGILAAALAYVGIRRAIGGRPVRPQFGGVPQIGG
jgi:uncharacterized protein (DUF2062 family)